MVPLKRWSSTKPGRACGTSRATGSSRASIVRIALGVRRRQAGHVAMQLVSGHIRACADLDQPKLAGRDESVEGVSRDAAKLGAGLTNVVEKRLFQ